MRLACNLPALAWVALLGCGIACAQPAEVARFAERPRLVVAPATTFIEEAQGSRAYPLHESLILNRRRSKASADIHAAGVVARLFRLGSSGPAVPRPWRTIGHCDVYFTNVIEVPRASDPASTALSLGRFDDVAWLSPNVEAGRMEAGRYLVIFEQDTEKSQRVFRLFTRDREEYFRQGYLLVLEPPPNRRFSSDEVKAIRDRLEGARAAVDQEAARNDPTSVCFFLKKATPVRNDLDATTVATVPCDDSLLVEGQSG